MNFIKGTLFLFSLLFSVNSLADANNCNAYEKKKGFVERVAVGIDESNPNYISFSMEINNKKTGFISVKQPLTDDGGRAMLDLLLEAARTQSLFYIERCFTNQLAAGYLANE